MSQRYALRLPEPPGPVSRWEWVLLGVAMLAGGILRFAFLGSLPPGLWYDEAINGLDALTVLREPGWPLFFTTQGHPREALYMYLEALGVLVGGTSAPALRGVSALIGTLTIPAVWWMARELGGRRAAALTLLFFVPMRWHVHFSRLAFRTILSPLFCALLTVFLVRTARDKRVRDAVALGALGALSLATYLSMRLFLGIAVLGLLGALPAILTSAAGSRKHLLKPLAGGVLAFGVCFLPIGIDYARNPEHFTGRQDEVSLLNQGLDGWARIAYQMRDVVLMPVLRGDHEAKHNIPGPPRFAQAYLISSDPADSAARWQDAAHLLGKKAPDPHGTGLPVFDLLTGLLFMAGFCFCVWRNSRREWAAFFVIVWLVVGSLASIFSFGAPNMLRLLLLTPAVAFALAVACEEIGPRIARRWGTRMAAVLLACLGVWYAGGETWRYFAVWPRHPDVYWKFNTNFREAADWLAGEADVPETVVAPGYFLRDTPTFAFLADGVQSLVADDAEAPPPLHAGTWILAPRGPFPPVRIEGSDQWEWRTVRAFEIPEGGVWLEVLEAKEKRPER
ncbi:MAG: hypothetical protein PWP23_1477 [Candidatus Sumerlaeota bacterium]|nr:hypothetical protein [Candidatus Sumerlaeota bacterium]